MSVIGNKNAVGNKGGCPRKTSFSKDEMIKLGEEMIEWIKNHPNILHLSEWYTIEKGFIYNEWKCFIQRSEFIPFYEIALKLVGRKYLDKTSNVRESQAQRWSKVYFKDYYEHEAQVNQEQLDRELEHKKAIIDHGAIAGVNSYGELLPTFDAHMKQISEVQAKISNNQVVLSIEDNSINEETKS